VAQELREKLSELKVYVREHGVDMPAVLNWKWAVTPAE
jgi:phosphoketolase